MVMFNDLWFYCNCYAIIRSFSLGFFCWFFCVFFLCSSRDNESVLERAHSRAWLNPDIDGVNKMWLNCIMYICDTFVNKIILFCSVLSCSVLFCSALLCTALHYSILFYSIIFCCGYCTENVPPPRIKMICVISSRPHRLGNLCM